MKIGIAGPISLHLLNIKFDQYELPEGVLTFPLIANIVNGLMELGHEIVVYTFAKRIKHSIIIRKEKITICIAPRKPSPGKRFFKSEITELSKLMEAYPSDIINAQWTYEYSLAAVKTQIPTVITIRDHAYTILKFQIDPYRMIRYYLNYKTLRKANYFIANSHYLKDLINTKKYIKVVPNFYVEKLEQYFEDNKTILPKIITVSNGFGHRKNLSTALHAFKIIKKKYPEFEYHIIGQQMQEGADAYHYARKHNLMEGVFFRGALSFDQVLNEMKNSGINLHPSKEETFGNTVLESMVIGTPVVGGEKSGNIPYLLDNGNTGVLCDVTKPNSIAKAVFLLIENKNKYAAIRKTARTFAINNYSKKSALLQLTDVYSEIVNINS